MPVRLLLAALMAVAMTLAPLGMPAMAEAAAATVDHAEMAGPGHCDEQPAPASDPEGKDAGKSCCVAMCIAVVAPSDVVEEAYYHAAPERPGSDLDRRGFLGEIATPPPKFA